MKRTITFVLALGLVFALSGCSFVNKVKAKFKGNKTEKTETKKTASTAKKTTTKKAGTTKKRKRIFCKTANTYPKGSACWHWKRGARIKKKKTAAK